MSAIQAALFVATASATQDIVIDAFRIESLPESQQAAGMAAYVAAYRIGMLAGMSGVNDFFGKDRTVLNIDAGRAKKVLAAFREGSWRKKLTGARRTAPA